MAPKEGRLMAGKGRPGRKKEYDVKGWVYLPVRIPQEMWRAFRLECFRKELRHTELMRRLLENHLQKAGLLKVKVTRDASGHKVKSYEVLES